MQRGLRLLEFDAKPSWALDEQAWEHAKKLAAGHEGQGDYNAIVTHLYKSMGGRVGNPPVDVPKPVKSADEKALDLVVQNPDMSAPTLLNTMKSQGIALVDKTVDEADSGSSFPQVLRGQTESHKMQFMGARLIESASSDDGIGPTSFRTILIQEGLGNFGNAFYYTKEALMSGVPIFEGKKIYADHPSKEEESTRPERSVRDVLGYFSDVQVVESKEDGRMMLTARVRMMDEQHYAWARGLMRYAIEYSKKFPDKDFVGLSINATGDAQAAELSEFMTSNRIPSSAKPKLLQAKEMGIQTIRVVSKLTEATSCDLVTEAGAGGRILEMIEQEKTLMAKGTAEKNTKKTKEGGPGSGPRPGGGRNSRDKRRARHDKKKAAHAALAKKDAELIKQRIGGKGTKAQRDKLQGWITGARAKGTFNPSKATFSSESAAALEGTEFSEPQENLFEDLCEMCTSGVGLTDETVDAKISEHKVSAEEACDVLLDILMEADDASEEPHDDAAQDVELVKSMLKKYAGKKNGDDEEEEGFDESDMALGKEMYYAAKEMGYEGEECMQAAGYGMRMAKHMAGKKADALKKESEAKEAEAKEAAAKEAANKTPIEKRETKVVETKDATTAQEPDDDEEEDRGAEPKEADPETSAKESAGADPKDKQILELTARLGVAEGKLKDIELDEYLDRQCKESRLPNSLTSKFKETLGKPKSQKHIDDALKLYISAASAAILESKSSPGFVLSLEKSVDEAPRKVSFVDCLRNE